MATVKHQLHPEGAQLPSSNFAALGVPQGTNFPVSGLAFDATTAESAFWKLKASNYGSGNLTLDLDWYADTATAEDVVWGASIAAITPNTDTQDIETKAFATENTVQDTHLGTTGQRLHRCTITISNLDSLAADDYVCLKIRRIPTDGADDMSGDAILVLAELSYSDS